MMKGIEHTDGIQVIGNMDDDRVMVGPSTGWPWTTYVLADAHDFDAVTAACNLFRSIQVGPSQTGCGNIAKLKPEPGAN